MILEVVLSPPGLLTLLLLLLICLHVSTRYKSLEHPTRLPPGSMGLPVVGETIELALLKEKFMTNRHKKHGPIFKTHLFGSPTVRVTGAENIRAIIMGEGKTVRSSWPRSVRHLFGKHSLSMSAGQHHKEKRRKLLDSLSASTLEKHMDHFSGIVVSAVEAWIGAGRPVDVFDECCKLTMASAVRLFIQRNPTTAEIERVSELINTIINNLFSLPYTIPGFGFEKAMDARRKTAEIILRNLKKNVSIDSSILHHIRSRLEENAADETIVDLTMEMLIAGSGTTTSAAFAVIKILAEHGHVLERVREELDQHGLLRSSKNGSYPELTFRALSELAYLQRVLNETLRLIPPIGGAYREVMKPIELQGYTIPENWKVVISIRDTQRSDAAFRDALSFDPDRWVSSAEGQDPYNFIPFGAGARKCVGKEYAKLFLKTLIVELARRSQWKFDRDHVEMLLFPTPRPKEKAKAVFRKLFI